MSSIQTPLLPIATLLAYLIHVGAGAVALISGLTAVAARKGGPLHRKAGIVFVFSMIAMAVFACYLAVMIPDQIVNVFISIFVLYLILTAWITVRRKNAGIGLPERLALFVGVCLCAPFVILSFQLATGLPPLFKSAVPFEGPVLIAIYAFTSVLIVAAIGDARIVFSAGVSPVARISRHLWRMCLGLTLALGSGFTNGLARLLPGPYHVPSAFFFPQFLPLVLMIYWLARMSIKGWLKRTNVISSS